MTFAVMTAILLCLSSRRWEMRTGWAVAVLIMVFLWFEAPLSGMSLNPARPPGSAVAAGRWSGLWVYFTAAVAAALLAAEWFIRSGDMTAMRSAGLTPSPKPVGRPALVAGPDQCVPQFPTA